MNDEPPSELSPPPEQRDSDEAPPFWAMFALGIGLFILSVLICAGAQSPAPLLLGALGAFVSVFFRGWRGIFAGYLAIAGLILLAVIIVCGTGIVPPFHE